MLELIALTLALSSNTVGREQWVTLRKPPDPGETGPPGSSPIRRVLKFSTVVHGERGSSSIFWGAEAALKILGRTSSCS
jgi:hypothetical protein